MSWIHVPNMVASYNMFSRGFSMQMLNIIVASNVLQLL